MAFYTVQISAFISALALCGANITGAAQDAIKTSEANPNPISMASPESSVAGLRPRPAPMNMMGPAGIDEIIADAMKNTMGTGGSPMGRMPIPMPSMMNTRSMRPTIPTMPSMGRPMNIFGGTNPLSMFTGGSGGPFSMMRPMMMMNIFENMFEMFGF